MTPLRIDDEPERCAEARQLCISDLEDPDVRTALALYDREDGQTILDVIASIARQYKSGVREPFHSDARIFQIDTELMLFEGCHRASALWESGLDRFQLLAPVYPLSWWQYEPAVLRRN